MESDENQYMRSAMLECPIFHALVGAATQELLEAAATRPRHLRNRILELESIWEAIVIGPKPKDSFRSSDLRDRDWDAELYKFCQEAIKKRELLTGDSEEDYGEDNPFMEEDPLNGT